MAKSKWQNQNGHILRIGDILKAARYFRDANKWVVQRLLASHCIYHVC